MVECMVHTLYGREYGIADKGPRGGGYQSMALSAHTSNMSMMIQMLVVVLLMVVITLMVVVVKKDNPRKMTN